MKKLTLAANLLLLLLVGCGKKESIPGDHGTESALKNKGFFDRVGEVNAYNPQAYYKEKMKVCIYAETDEASCKFSDLPLLGMNKKNITVSDILDRTMVSHQFLGDTFQQVLLRMNPEMLKMFGSVNTIVISDKINPSFFYRRSGAIYLSGRYFWRNYSEWELLTKVRDFREAYELSFKFATDEDYIKNGKSIDERANSNAQSYDEISLKLAKLLFHELTHANDYFPSSVYSSSTFDSKLTYAEVSIQRYRRKEIASLKQSFLASEMLDHIGQVLFQGDEALPSDSLTSVEEVISEFKNDLASDFYAYSSPMEDLAMTSEEALMLYYYDMPRIVLLYKLPYANFVVPDDYVYQIAWGEKSRVLEPNIKSRALAGIENSLGKDIALKVSNKLAPLKFQEFNTKAELERLIK